MGKVVQLRPLDTTECCDTTLVIEAIEKIADAARNGEIDGIMMTWSKDGRIINELIAGEITENRSLAQSAVHRMLQRIQPR